MARLAACILVGLCAGAVSLAAQAPADLTGTWRYNAEASDVGTSGDGSGPPTSRLPIGGFGMPGRQPLGGPGAPGGFGGPGSENPELRKQRLELMQELLQPVRRMTIAQETGVVTFTYDDGRTVRYRTDGRMEKHQAVHGVVETETRWKKGRLVRETDLDDGTSIEESFTIASPRALVLEVKVHGGGPGRRKPLRRVYDPVE